MKKFIEKIINPPVWLCVLTMVLTVGAIAAALFFVISGSESVLTYVSYGLSAVMLTYAVYIIVRFSKKAKQRFASKIFPFPRAIS